jgi:peptidoglycan/LPS O-acetylase OafA/YrhL
LLVVWYHVIVHGKWTEFPITGLALLPQVGWVGVDLFLVISGFVIGKTAMEAFERDPNWRRAYLERRLRRIVPLHLATVFIFVLLISPQLLMYGGNSLFHLVTHVLFLHNLFPSTYGSINGVNWSVALEMQFYLLIAFSTPWLARTSWPKVMLVWVAVAVSWRFMTTLFLVPGQANVQHQIVAATMLPGTLDQFVMGICLAKLTMGGKLKYTHLRFVGWSLATVLLLTAAWMTFTPRSAYWYFPPMVWFWRTLVSAGFAALVGVVVMIPYSGGWVTKPVRYLGEISYGIYLWHLPVLMALIAQTPWRGYSLLRGTLIGTVMLAALSWHGFEKLWMASGKVKTVV